MPNANDRLARFEKAVFSEVEREACEILSEVDVYKEQKLSGVQDQELQQSYQKIQRKLDEIRSGFSKGVTREKLLQTRQKLVEELFADAEAQVSAFTETPDYDAYLQKALDKNRRVLSGDAKILARPADVERVKKLAGETPVEVSSSIRLGGLVIVVDEKSLYVDETLDARMEAAKEQFYASGKADLK